MSPEFDLSALRISAQTRPLVPENLTRIEVGQISQLEQELKTVVLDYNFDTFSFMFALLEEAKQKGLPLKQAFTEFNVNSAAFVEKYRGSNSVGLSMKLRSNLADRSIPTYFSASHGNYLLTPEADDYGQIRTVDLIALLSGKDNRWVFLAPGLTIDKPMVVSFGSRVEAFGSTYLIGQVSNDGFEVITVKPNGDTINRSFALEEVLNPDESVQKNLLRTRTRYQITKQYEDGKRDLISFDFPKRMFKVSIEGTDLVLDIKKFKAYLNQNAAVLEARFRNPHLAQGLLAFVESVDEITDQLLLPAIQNILSQLWKSS